MNSVLVRLERYRDQLPERLRIVLIGGCLGSGFLHPLLVLVSIVGLFCFFLELAKVPSCKGSIRLAWGVWYIKSLAAVSWFWSTYPISWLPFQSDLIQLPIIAVYWLTTALWLSSTGFLIGIVYWYGKKYISREILLITVFSMAVVLAEQVGALVFSIATIGPGITPNAFFGFGQLGIFVAFIPGLITLSWWGGLYGLSLVLVAAVASVAFGRWRTVMVRAGVVLLVLYGASFATGFLLSPPLSPAKIAVIDTHFDAALLATDEGTAFKQTQLAEAVRAARSMEVSHILLPEDSRFLQSLVGEYQQEQALAYFKFNFPGSPVVLLDSGLREVTPGQSVLRATTFDTETGELLEYDKQYLVPQGEFIPYLYAGVLRLIGFGSTIDSLEARYTYYPGRAHTTPASKLPPVLFCFESVNPLGVQRALQNGDVPFIAHPISHAWFNHPALLQNQLTALLRIQAVWNELPIVSAANQGESAVYYPTGRVGRGEVVATGERYTIRLVTLP